MIFFKKIAVLLFVLLPFITSAQNVPEPKFSVEKKADGVILIEDFEGDEVGTLPHRWYNRDADYLVSTMPQEEKDTYYYDILEEKNNKYLHYAGTRVRHLNFPLKNKDINIYETPVLSWKWRALNLPEGANEDQGSANDAVASVYVVFDFGRVLFKKVPKSIRYTWSSTLEEGTETSKLFGNQQIVVLESGPEKVGQWVTFKRNIVEDYRRLFGDDPPEKPLAILLMSDGDSTGNISVADYDDIYLLPAN